MPRYLIENVGETEEHVHPKGEKKAIALQRGQNLIGEFTADEAKALNRSNHLRVTKRADKADEAKALNRSNHLRVTKRADKADEPAPEPAAEAEEAAHELTPAEQKAPSPKS